MKLFQRIFFAAVLAGLAAGLLMSAIQQWQVTPLVLEAEVFETVAPEAAAHAREAGTPAHEHDEEAWAPQDGAERILYTVLANVLASTGFALLLGAVSTLSGIEITTRSGIVWGLCGFAAFQLAPAFGLPPELPGMAAAELGARQLWWWSTALATGAAALVVAKLHNRTALIIGAALILVPHIVGAPATPDEPTAVPAHLAAAFAAKSLGSGAMFWLTVGPLLGWLSERFARISVTAAKGAHA